MWIYLRRSISLKQKKDDVINYFVTYHKMGTKAAKYAAALVLHLCYKYGIPLAEELKKKTHTGTGKPRKKKEITKEKPTKRGEGLNNFQNNIYEEEPIEGKVILKIIGNGLNRGLSASNKEELEDLYKVKFKSLVDAAKLLFLDEPKEEEPSESTTEEEI